MCINYLGERRGFYDWYVKENTLERKSFLKFLNLCPKIMNRELPEWSAGRTVAGYACGYVIGDLEDYENHVRDVDKEESKAEMKKEKSRMCMEMLTVNPKHEGFLEWFAKGNSLPDVHALTVFCMRNPECLEGGKCPKDGGVDENMWDTITFMKESYEHNHLTCEEWTNKKKCVHCAQKLGRDIHIGFIEYCIKKKDEDAKKIFLYFVKNPTCATPGSNKKGTMMMMDERIRNLYIHYCTAGESDDQNEKIRLMTETRYDQTLDRDEVLLDAGVELIEECRGECSAWMEAYELFLESPLSLSGSGSGSPLSLSGSGSGYHDALKKSVEEFSKDAKHKSMYDGVKELAEQLVECTWESLKEEEANDNEYDELQRLLCMERVKMESEDDTSNGVYYAIYATLKCGIRNMEAFNKHKRSAGAAFGRPSKKIAK